MSLGDYLDEGSTRTDLLRDAAECLVELRSRHTLKDGRTDWGGRSADYRRAAGTVYRTARVDQDAYKVLHNALAWHVSNAIRERASEADLEALGIKPLSYAERLRRRRSTAAAAAEAAGVTSGTSLVEVPKILGRAEVLLEAADLHRDHLGDLSDVNRVASRIALERIVETSSRLLERVNTIDASAAGNTSK